MKKIVLAVVLLVLAGTGAFYLKEYIDSRQPRYSIPQLHVMADTAEVPVLLSGYDWTFRTGKQAVMPEVLYYDVNQAPKTLLGGERLEIELTRTNPLKLDISRSATPYTYDWIPIESASEVPFEKGVYIYSVYALYEEGNVLYYFLILVE